MTPLEQAAKWFQEYAESHTAKGKADKAEQNSRRAKWLLEQEDSQANEIKALKKEVLTLQDALAQWQGVVRVARDRDSTLPAVEGAPC